MKKVQKSIYSEISIKELCLVRDGDHNKLPVEFIASADEGIRYLRAQDLREGEILSDAPVFVKGEYFDSILRSHIKAGYFLFSIMASIGNIAVVPEGFPDCTANRAVGIMIPKDKARLDTNYLFALFSTNFGISLLNKLKRGGIQKRTNLSDIESLKIPLPPLDVQRSLVSELEAARQSRKQKLAQADKLLSSLDTYLLDQLELTPPKERKRRTFAVKLEKIKSGRFDPKFALSQKEISGKFKAVELGKLVTLEPEYGSGSRAVPMRTPKDIKYIRITDFKDDGIALGHEFVSAEVIEDQYFLEHKDFLFARSGATAGKTFIYTRDIGSAIFAGYCIRFRFNKNLVLPWFVYFYTKTSLYKSWVNSIQRPSGQPNINKEEFKSFRIVLPPLDIQHTLVVEMQHRREQAQQLQQEAETEWEVAKTRFERKLLGEEE